MILSSRSPRDMRRRSGPLVRAAAAALLAVHIALALGSARRQSVTFDEPCHIFAGLSYWTTGDFRLAPENPPLVQLLCAALPALAGSRMPDLEAPDSPIAWAWRHGDAYMLGRAWLFAGGNDPQRLVMLARLPIAAISALGGWLLFAMMRRAAGDPPALAALALWSFSPTLLAHAGLATPDLPAAVFFLAAAISFWRLTRALSPLRFAAASLSLAALFTTKFTAWLLVPGLAAMVAVRLLRRDALVVVTPFVSRRPPAARLRSRPARLALMTATAMALAGTTIAAVWAAFAFRFEGSPGGDDHYPRWMTDPATDPPEAEWAALGAPPHGPLAKAGPWIAWARHRRLLPEAYLYGLAYVNKMSQGRMAYLNGQVRSTGWWFYFPFAILIKSSPALLALAAVGAVRWLSGMRARAGRPRRTASIGRKRADARVPTLLPAAIFLGLAMNSSLNIGLRHVLPVYPGLFVLAAGAVARRSRRQAKRPLFGVAATALVAVHAAIALRAYPNYLAYFNVWGGGCENGWRRLTDSNHDWGQGLIQLGEFLSDHRRRTGDARTLKLSYFGSADPRHYLGEVEALPGFMPYTPDVISALAPDAMPPPPAPLTPGLYAISATQLSGLYVRYGPHWRPEYDQEQVRAESFLDRLKAVRSDGGDGGAGDGGSAGGGAGVGAGRSASDVGELIEEHRDWLAGQFPPDLRQAFAQDPRRFERFWPQLIDEVRRAEYDLRFLRLIIALRDRRPMARPGETIAVHDLSAGDLARAGCVSPP